MGTKRQRRTVSAEFKARVVLEGLTGQKTGAQVCRAQQQLKPALLSRWKSDFVAHPSSVFSGDAREHQAEQRIAALERLVGRLSLEREVAQKTAVPPRLRPRPAVERWRCQRACRGTGAGPHRAERAEVADLRLSPGERPTAPRSRPSPRDEQPGGCVA
jgi:transposase-like protein